MISKLKERCKNKKGFTLVELIVVLVILAILIALLVPTLTGYIDKANEKKVLAEAKLALNAAQTEESDAYGKASQTTAGYTPQTVNVKDPLPADKAKADAVKKLAEVKSFTAFTYSTDSTGKVTKLLYENDKYRAEYYTEEGVTADKTVGWTATTK